MQGRTFATEDDMNLVVAWLGQNFTQADYDVDRLTLRDDGLWEAVIWFQDVAKCITMDEANVHLYVEPTTDETP